MLLGMAAGLLGMVIMALADPKDRLFWRWPAIGLFAWLTLFGLIALVGGPYPDPLPVTAVTMVGIVTAAAALIGAFVGWLLKKVVRLL
jgi:hypothetical protein